MTNKAKIRNKKKETKLPYLKASFSAAPLALAGQASVAPLMIKHVSKGFKGKRPGKPNPVTVGLLKKAKKEKIRVHMSSGKDFKGLQFGNPEIMMKAQPGYANLEGKKAVGKGRINRFFKTLKAQKPYVHASSYLGPEVLAHELGHVPQLKRFGNTGIYRRALASGAMGLGGTISSAGTYIKGRSKKGSKEYKRADIASKGGIAVSALGAGKILADEVGASARGLKYVRQAGANARTMVKGARNLGLAFGSYVGTLGAGVAAPYLYRKYKARQRPMKERTFHKLGAKLRGEKP